MGLYGQVDVVHTDQRVFGKDTALVEPVVPVVVEELRPNCAAAPEIVAGRGAGGVAISQSLLPRSETNIFCRGCDSVSSLELGVVLLLGRRWAG